MNFNEIMAARKERGRKVLHEFDENSFNAAEINKQLLKTILSESKDTEYGRKYNFAGIKSIEDFKRMVPFTTYDDYEPYITRMVENGEKNLLTANNIVYYASTSGTTSAPKKVPLSDKGFEIFRKYLSTSLAVAAEYYQNVKYDDSLIDGLKMLTISLNRTRLKCGVDFGCISATAFDDVSAEILKYIFTTPKEVTFYAQSADMKYLHARFAVAERNITMLSCSYIPILLDTAIYIQENLKMLIEDIREGKINEAVNVPADLREALKVYLKPNPERADELERAVNEDNGEKLLKRIWPRLAYVSCIWAGNFNSYARNLQKNFTGRSIAYQSMIYASSEGTIGFPRHPFEQSYCVIPNSCFFEFIPENEKDSPNPKTLLIDELEDNKDYELVITNQSGFYRYRIGDVIRVTGFYNEVPMIEFKYRVNNIVSITGEKFTEDNLLSAIREFERRTGINVNDYCMYPDRDTIPPRYVVFIEPENIVPKERYEECEDILRDELARSNSLYALCLEESYIGKPKIIFLQQQTFQLQREIKMYKTGLNENQIKTVRVLKTPELIKFFTGQAER